MNDEKKTIIAFVFKRSGKQKLSFSDLYLTLSVDLNWFTPEEAKKFIKKALEQKILIKKDEMISPSFDIEKTEIPSGFYPSEKKFTERNSDKKTMDKKTIIDELIEKIEKNTKQEKAEIMGKIAQIERQKNITREVAVLIVAKEYRINIESFFDKIEKNIVA